MCRVYMNLRVRCLLFETCFLSMSYRPRAGLSSSYRRVRNARLVAPHDGCSPRAPARRTAGRGAAGVRSRGSGIRSRFFNTRALTRCRVSARRGPGRYPSVAGPVAAGRPVAARRQRPRGGPARKTPRLLNGLIGELLVSTGHIPTVIPGPSYRPTKPSRPGLSFLAFRRINPVNPLCSLMLHALGCIATYHETTHAVSCPSALEGCMHASSETHAVSECTMFRHTCVAQSPTPFPPYSHP